MSTRVRLRFMYEEDVNLWYFLISVFLFVLRMAVVLRRAGCICISSGYFIAL